MSENTIDLLRMLREIKPADRRDVEEDMVSILKNEERVLGADHPIWLIGGYNPERQPYLATNWQAMKLGGLSPFLTIPA